jgi:hypothetical protein
LFTSVLGVARPAFAVDGEASQRVTYFREPSGSTGCSQGEDAECGITVVHPQTDVSATFGSAFGIALGYSVDIVSGATPAVLRVPEMDAVSTATKFSDTRHQVRSALTFIRSVAEISAGYSYGWESDYKSQAVTVTTRSDVLDHAFTLGLSYTHNFDSVCDQNNADTAGRPLDRRPLINSATCFQSASTESATRRLHIDTIEPSLTWAATPRLLLQSGGTIQVLDGFQANPYRSVELGSGGRTPQESRPELRQRFALFGRAAYAMPGVRGSVLGTVRIYRDTWAVQAATAELAYNQYLIKSLLVTLRGRMHTQQGASFYRDALDYRNLGPNGAYWTGDRELSPMQNMLFGGKLAYLRIAEQDANAFFTEIEIAAKFEALLYMLDSAYAPNSDRKRAIIWQLAASARF